MQARRTTPSCARGDHARKRCAVGQLARSFLFKPLPNLSCAVGQGVEPFNEKGGAVAPPFPALRQGGRSVADSLHAGEPSVLPNRQTAAVVAVGVAESSRHPVVEVLRHVVSPSARKHRSAAAIWRGERRRGHRGNDQRRCCYQSHFGSPHCFAERRCDVRPLLISTYLCIERLRGQAASLWRFVASAPISDGMAGGHATSCAMHVALRRPPM